MQIEHVSFIVCVVSFPAFCDIIGRDTNANTNTCQHKTSSAHVCAQVHIMQIIVTTLSPLSFLVQAPFLVSNQPRKHFGLLLLTSCRGRYRTMVLEALVALEFRLGWRYHLLTKRWRMVTAGAAPQIDSRRQDAAASVEVSSSSDDGLEQVPEIVQVALPTFSCWQDKLAKKQFC